MKTIIFLICLCLPLSCVSFDVERRVTTRGGPGRPEREELPLVVVPIDAVPEPRVIEKPVYVPPASSPPAPAQGRAAVEQSNRAGITGPQEYSSASMIYDYHGDWVYEVYCQPLRVTDLRLRPGEKTVELPYISDSERWMLGAGVNYEDGVGVQHIYLKPTAANLEATLIINTNERAYHLILRSYANLHMPMVRWRYHASVLPKNYLNQELNAEPGSPRELDPALFADPRFLSFNYRVTYSLFRKPRWTPTLVYDDGKKTYITFPDEALLADMPSVFENRDDVLNYRVARNVLIIDKLVEQITVKIGKLSVVIDKKRG